MKQVYNHPAILLLTVLLMVLSGLALPSSSVAADPACGTLITNKCLACHYETRICQKVKKKKGERSWKKTIKSMIRNGAVLSREEQKILAVCLSKPDSAVLELCGMAR